MNAYLQTPCGPVRGLQREGYLEWLGVPYAKAGRFEDPQQLRAWEGTLDATRPSARFWQYTGVYGKPSGAVEDFYNKESRFSIDTPCSEDAFTLNIWASDEADGDPVLVFIHGGSYVMGSNLDMSTDGAAYARRRVVTVALNYRLGPFATPLGDGYTGNLALKDQLCALLWIRDNIAAFGGDPSRITVMGESAGAISVQNLLISPLIPEGLICGAILMSGAGDLSSLGQPMRAEAVLPVWEDMKKAFYAQTVQQLRCVPVKAFYKQWMISRGKLLNAAAYPVLDPDVLPETPGPAMAAGRDRNVPCIIGLLSQDMWPHTLCKAAFGFADARAARGGAPVWLYQFDHRIDERFGAFHGGDLYYAFGSLARNRREASETDLRISREMVRYFANFAATGDPNRAPEGAKPETALPYWQTAAESGDLFLRFSDGPSAMAAADLEALARQEKEVFPFPYEGDSPF